MRLSTEQLPTCFLHILINCSLCTYMFLVAFCMRRCLSGGMRSAPQTRLYDGPFRALPLPLSSKAHHIGSASTLYPWGSYSTYLFYSSCDSAFQQSDPSLVITQPVSPTDLPGDLFSRRHAVTRSGHVAIPKDCSLAQVSWRTQRVPLSSCSFMGQGKGGGVTVVVVCRSGGPFSGISKELMLMFLCNNASVTMESRDESSPHGDITEPTPSASTGHGKRPEKSRRKRLPLKKELLVGYHSSSESEESEDDPKPRRRHEVGHRSRAQLKTSRCKPFILPLHYLHQHLLLCLLEMGKLEVRGTLSEMREGKRKKCATQAGVAMKGGRKAASTTITTKCSFVRSKKIKSLTPSSLCPWFMKQISPFPPYLMMMMMIGKSSVLVGKSVLEVTVAALWRSSWTQHRHRDMAGKNKARKTEENSDNNTGVALRVVQNLVKCFRELGEDVLPAPLPKSGRPKLLSPRTLKVTSRQVQSNPSLTAREVKERNPRLLSHVSLRCVQQALHDDLGFKSFRARCKPLLTKRQKENRVKY
ncbi:hypothetical protein Hamer_G012421 [Homarus americanus]|uniref:Uncharacterized protein n=1 Tax=Homarus americanus TaxID=6706 RepID=A0A8J5KLS7_HOMAM|nr:hypothetical protein Hamer_G012421 [Homarus americanus]